MNDSTRPTSLYKYFDTNGSLIYVGITSRGINRNREHNADKLWWQFVTRQEVQHFPDRRAALEAEKTLILQRRPPFNKQHNPGHDELVTEYLKFAHASRGGDSAGKIMQENYGRMPLEVHSWDPDKNLLLLRSRPEHIRLAVRVSKPEKLWAQHEGKRAYCMSMTHENYGLRLMLQGAWLGSVAGMDAVLTREKDKTAYTIRKLEPSPVHQTEETER